MGGRIMGRRKAGSKREGEGTRSKRRRKSAPKKKKEEEEPTGENAEISMPEAPAIGTVHPLLIPHVLEKVFQHIIRAKTEDEELAESASVAKNVKNLRLVCKQWKETATRLYRRNRVLIMSFGKTCPLAPSSNEKMTDFLDIMKNSDLIPIQRYIIKESCFRKEYQKSMKDFMRICGPVTVELRLYCDHRNTMRFTRRSFPDLELKKLKRLIFYGELETRTPDITQTNEIAYLIEALLNAAEKLHEFKFMFFASCIKLGSHWRQGMAKRCGELICKRIPKTVKILNLDLPLKDSHLITLTKSELKLEELKLELDALGGASSDFIRKFFERQAPTLKVLKIFDRVCGHGRPASQALLDFPRFDQLLHLELEEGGTIQKFSWPYTFPKLTTLDITEWKTRSTCMELLGSAKKGLSLEEIHLPYSFPQAPLVKKVAQHFPNITSLHIFPPDISDALQEVFVYLPNLEELNLTIPYDGDVFGITVDSILSGVPLRDCYRIREMNNFDNVNIGEIQHRPSMLNLTKLKKLVLLLQDPNDNVNLTDLTAHFVFLKMASLEELHTYRFQMSTKYVDLLREKLALNLFTE